MFNTISGQQNTGGADLPLLISGVQAAKTLGISPRSLWTLTRAGTIPFIQLIKHSKMNPAIFYKIICPIRHIFAQKYSWTMR